MGDTENKYDVLDSALRLARALRRNAPKHDHMLPPAVERTLAALNLNDGLSSGELCEALGVRPSSLSELIDRMEKHGLVQRSIDEQDKRIVRITLTEKGSEIAAKIAERVSSRKTEVEACFEDGEAEQFCALADKLSKHLQGENDDLPPFGGHGPRGFGGPGCGGPERGFGGPGCHRHGGNGPEGFEPQFGGPGHGPGMHRCHRSGGHEMGNRIGCKGPSVHGQFRHPGPWGCHKPEFRHPGPWDGHRPEIGHPGPWDCHKPEFRHPGPWDCHKPEFRHPGPWGCQRPQDDHTGPGHCHRSEFRSC